METILILNANIVNEGRIFASDVLIENGFISRIDKNLSGVKADRVLDVKGSFLLPGVIDDQVHFREPGLTHKATIYTESKAAVAGGVTTFMEMPNTVPNTLTQQLLEEKYSIGANTSLANYSFYMGASNDNLEEVVKTDRQNVCGIKVFMGSSTGNMLVDNEKTLEGIFSKADMLVAVHCEDEATIRANAENYRMMYGEDVPISAHAEIRNEDACYKSSSMAVELAKKYNTRLHVLHISTQKELGLFRNDIPLKDKKITSEACVHHLWFDKGDYERLGTLIKWNPAVKEAHHKKAILEAVLNDTIDVIATDHAPHTLEEKNNNYWKAPSGGPLVQHSLNIMLSFYRQGKISLEKIVQKMCHDVAICFQIDKRGYIREGYWADLVVVAPSQPWKVEKGNILYKCGWSPLEGESFDFKVTNTIVSGHLAYSNGQFNETVKGKRLVFNRV